LPETFAESKLQSKYLLKSKSEVISLRLSLSLKYLLRPKLSRTNLAKVGSICMEEIALALRA